MMSMNASGDKTQAATGLASQDLHHSLDAFICKQPLYRHMYDPMLHACFVLLRQERFADHACVGHTLLGKITQGLDFLPGLHLQIQCSGSDPCSSSGVGASKGLWRIDLGRRAL